MKTSKTMVHAICKMQAGAARTHLIGQLVRSELATIDQLVEPLEPHVATQLMQRPDAPLEFLARHSIDEAAVKRLVEAHPDLYMPARQNPHVSGVLAKAALASPYCRREDVERNLDAFFQELRDDPAGLESVCDIAIERASSGFTPSLGHVPKALFEHPVFQQQLGEAWARVRGEYSRKAENLLIALLTYEFCDVETAIAWLGDCASWPADDHGLGLLTLAPAWTNVSAEQRSQMLSIGTPHALLCVAHYLETPQEWSVFLDALVERPDLEPVVDRHLQREQCTTPLSGIDHTVVLRAWELQLERIYLHLLGRNALSDCATALVHIAARKAQHMYAAGKAARYSHTAVRLFVRARQEFLKTHEGQHVMPESFNIDYRLAPYEGHEIALAHLPWRGLTLPWRATAQGQWLTPVLRTLLGDSDPELWDLTLQLIHTSGQSLYQACETAHLVTGSQMPATWLDLDWKNPAPTEQAPSA